MLFYDIMSGDFLFAGYLENNLEKNPFFFAFSGTFCAF